MSKSKSSSVESESESTQDGGSSDNLQLQGMSNGGHHQQSIEEEDPDNIPKSPPPTYEYVLEENRLKSQENKSQESQQQSTQSNSNESPRPSPPPSIEIIHKSSKEMYKAVAKQFGITCKMSDDCRCLDCQSHYFDCDYDPKNPPNFNHQDGGLGASTPLYISEVMHVGSTCSIL